MNGLCSCHFGFNWPESVIIYTDACFVGFGAVMNDTFLLGTWDNMSLPQTCHSFNLNMVPQPLVDKTLVGNINFLELIAACLPLLVWAPLFTGKRVVIASDNKSTVSFLNRGTTKNAVALLWLKLVFNASLKYDVHFDAIYHPGVQNVATDALSRLSISPSYGEKFFEVFAAPFPGPCLPSGLRYGYPNIDTGGSLADFETAVYGELFHINQEVSVELV